MVEFAIVAAIFIFLLFAIIDFGRLMAQIALAEKAAYLAARTAVVRPYACGDGTGLPDRQAAVDGTTARYGTNCRDASAPCLQYAKGTFSCTGNASNPTVSEIWNVISPILPQGASPSNLTFSYDSDPNLGYLGGPFTPMVTVDLSLKDFTFISPLGGLLKLAGVSGTTLGSSVNLPVYSVSLPAEDLNLGDGG